jgi:hypothetical protein
MQSQSDRSVLGDRMRPSRAYSPFAGSVASVPLDDPVRKGSEELSQHRTILSLANDSKRGRYSPVPQAVQGAQERTPAPDAGIKSEHGRVFAGIGSGLGSASTGLNSTPQPLPASPFKRDEGGARLSEENLMKMSRSTSGITKRNRRTLEEDNRAESDVGDMKKGAVRGKRSKYGHKLDLEEPSLGQRKNGLLPTSNPSRRAATPTSNPTQPVQLARTSSLTGAAARSVPPKTKVFRISSVVAQASRKPRRHLGIYRYHPQISKSDFTQPRPEKFDVSIRPNILPSFDDPDQVNCTYTIKVSRTWLEQREQHLIAKEAFLWGTGIYTDDSDPVAAAIHSGFIESPFSADSSVDKVFGETNPRIDGLDIPEKPSPIPKDRDLHITLVVLPQLEAYASSVRSGVRSRSWPEPAKEGTSSAPHDGVSFMILKADFVKDGAQNRRMGRTGQERREVLRRELEDRKKSIELWDRKTAEYEAKQKEKKIRGKQRRQPAAVLADKTQSRPGPAASSNPTAPEANEKENQLPASQNVDQTDVSLDVGVSPETWLEQLNKNAVPA